METQQHGNFPFVTSGPHSLGKLIEWKQLRGEGVCVLFSVPTRWGN